MSIPERKHLTEADPLGDFSALFIAWDALWFPLIDIKYINPAVVVTSLCFLSILEISHPSSTSWWLGNTESKNYKFSVKIMNSQGMTHIWIVYIVPEWGFQ
jgi:hypothetical protein